MATTDTSQRLWIGLSERLQEEGWVRADGEVSGGLRSPRGGMYVVESAVDTPEHRNRERASLMRHINTTLRFLAAGQKTPRANEHLEDWTRFLVQLDALDQSPPEIPVEVAIRKNAQLYESVAKLLEQFCADGNTVTEKRLREILLWGGGTTEEIVRAIVKEVEALRVHAAYAAQTRFAEHLETASRYDFEPFKYPCG